MKSYILFLATLLVVIFPWGIGSSQTNWQQIEKGFAYSEIDIKPGTIYAIKINPKFYDFKVITAKDVGSRSSSVKYMATKQNALAAINGGFFTPEYDSLGLLINNGKVLNPLKKTSWWSIFYIKNNRPHIVHTNDFSKDSKISMAIQSGPRLLVNGSIPKLKPSIADRSVVCMNQKRDVLLVVTEGIIITPDELAKYLKNSEVEGGLGCTTALNLDGGSSTQMYAKFGSLNLNIPGINRVANAIGVFKK